MNLYNRIAVIVLAIVAVAAGLVVATSAEALLTAVQNWTTGATVTPSDRIAGGVLGAIVAIAGVVVLYLELRPRRQSTVVIKRLADGTVSLAVASIERRIREAVEAVPGVRQVDPHVRSLGQNVAVQVTVFAETTVDIPAKSEEIGGVVRDTVAQMGVGLGRQTVNLRYEGVGAKQSRPNV